MYQIHIDPHESHHASSTCRFTCDHHVTTVADLRAADLMMKDLHGLSPVGHPLMMSPGPVQAVIAVASFTKRKIDIDQNKGSNYV